MPQNEQGYPIGTIRIWADNVKHVKTSRGWEIYEKPYLSDSSQRILAKMRQGSVLVAHPAKHAYFLETFHDKSGNTHIEHITYTNLSELEKAYQIRLIKKFGVSLGDTEHWGLNPNA